MTKRKAYIIHRGTAGDRAILAQQRKEFNSRRRIKAATHTLGSAYPQAWDRVKENLRLN